MVLWAHVLHVERFFQLGSFTAASVQRDYVWDSQQSEDLLADIERACAAHAPEAEAEPAAGPVISIAEETEGEAELADGLGPLPIAQDDAPGYLLGSVVLLRAGPGTFEIFDGLQRATTLTILLCVIRDLTASSRLRARIGKLIQDGGSNRLIFPGADSTLSIEIQAPGHTKKTFRRLVSARGQRMRHSRSLFHRYLSTWDEERLSRFAGFLLSHTQLVVCETTSQALARQVFITANDRGVQLRPVDIFKGHLLSLAGSAEAAEKVARRWNGISYMLGEGLADFMRAYDFIKRKEPQGSDYLAKLATAIETKFGADGLEDVLEDIQRHATTWTTLIERLKNPPTTEADLDIWRLRLFKWFEWRPMALAWYHAYCTKRNTKAGGAGTKAEQAFRTRFAALHRICIMMTLAKFSANDRARIFGRALSQSRNPFSTNELRPGALTFRPPQIVRILETLGTPLYDEEIRLSLMRWLESMYGLPEAAADTAKATVEHVLPQRPAAGSQWLTVFPDEEQRFSACHSIGNLALMDYSENVKITNHDFHLKLPVIQEQSKKYRTLACIAGKTGWEHGDIRQRAARLILFACGHLNIPLPRQE